MAESTLQVVHNCLPSTVEGIVAEERGKVTRSSRHYVEAVFEPGMSAVRAFTRIAELDGVTDLYACVERRSGCHSNSNSNSNRP